VSAAESTKSAHRSGHRSGVEPKSGSQAQAVFFSTQVSATGSFSLSSPVDGDLGNKLSCQRILILAPLHPAQEDSQSGINCQRQGGVDTQCRRHGFEQDLDCVRDSSQILLLW
jgi:hypothetical protein